jgi:hypothetical protein
VVEVVVGVGLVVATKVGVVDVFVVGAVEVVVVGGAIVVVLVVVDGDVVVLVLTGLFEKFKTETFLPLAKNDTLLFLLIVGVALAMLVLISPPELVLVLGKMKGLIVALPLGLAIKDLEKNALTF